MIEESASSDRSAQWAKVIDHTRCIGCHACTTACKSENVVPIGVTRTYVKHVDVGVWPQVRRAHQVTRCNQCAHAPCVTACPTAAMFKRADGIVDFDKSICIGCKACMAACPYDAIFINPEDHSAEKCNLCAHRIDVGLEPACVVVCPTQAILIGDMNDQSSYVAQIVNREAVNVRRPEKETLPKLFYKGAHQATLDPLAARRPEAGLFMWSEQQQSNEQVVSGNPTYNNSSAAALLTYDVAHSIPWDWRVSLYTWTKGIASGVYLVAALLVLRVGIGPYHARATAFDPAVIATAWTNRRVRLAYAGYFGHMWELYAMWAWIAAATAASYGASLPAPEAERLAKLTAFVAIALGGLACAGAGLAADRIGKANVTIVAMVASGAAALATASTFGGAPWLTFTIVVLWGIAIVPDSAQFSALVADAAPPAQAGSLMSLQTALGFALTILTVQATPLLAVTLGWPLVLAGLALGPAFGVVAMLRLRAMGPAPPPTVGR